MSEQDFPSLVPPDPYKVKLIRNTKGYQWEISVSGKQIKNILGEILEIDTALIEQYGPQGGGD